MKVLLLIVSLVSILVAETVFSGVIDAQERWTLEGSPYILTNDVHITSNGRLVIEPGVEVLVESPQRVPVDILQENSVDSFGVMIKVEGAIYCEGKEHNPVVFKGRYVNEKYTHWCGIVINSHRSDEILISYTKISDATTAIEVRKGMPLIRNVVLEYNNIGFSSLSLSTPRLIQSNISGNFLTGIRINAANPELYNNIVTSNRNVGIWADRVSDFTFKNNLVFGNGDRNFVDCPPEMGKMVDVNRNGDSVDVYENLTEDPLFEGSPGVLAKRAEIAKEKADKSLKDTTFVKEDTLAKYAEESKRYQLSEFSPCINAGRREGDKFKEVDGSDADLGIFGGPEHIVFK